MRKFFLLFFIIVFISCSKEPIVVNKYVPVTTELVGDNLTFLNLLNNYRVGLGLNPLIPEKLVTELCQTHADDEAREEDVNHDGFFKRYLDSHATDFSEVVAGRYITPESMFSAYLHSPKHYYILINPSMTHVGIASKDGYQCVDLAMYGEPDD